MNAVQKVDITQDARFAGIFMLAGAPYALIVAPKADGEHEGAKWNKSTKAVDDATSYFDGLANTKAMAAAGSAIAKWALALRIDGFDDWYLPSRDELELLYRRFKPTAAENYVYRSGDNPSSVPSGYPYTAAAPAKTSLAAFQQGGADAFDPTWYWSSTQYASSNGGAWCQSFDNGGQNNYHKNNELRARAVRRVPL